MEIKASSVIFGCGGGGGGMEEKESDNTDALATNSVAGVSSCPCPPLPAGCFNTEGKARGWVGKG